MSLTKLGALLLGGLAIYISTCYARVRGNRRVDAEANAKWISSIGGFGSGPPKGPCVKQIVPGSFKMKYNTGLAYFGLDTWLEIRIFEDTFTGLPQVCTKKRFGSEFIPLSVVGLTSTRTFIDSRPGKRRAALIGPKSHDSIDNPGGNSWYLMCKALFIPKNRSYLGTDGTTHLEGAIQLYGKEHEIKRLKKALDDVRYRYGRQNEQQSSWKTKRQLTTANSVFNHITGLGKRVVNRFSPSESAT